MNQAARFLQWLWERHPGRMLGTALGLVAGMVFLAVGFWRALIFAFFVWLGYVWGSAWERREDWRDVIERLLPSRYRDS
ncbi:MAG: DUF2273 domain-containing protein [Kyrpidia sp.]|nr:DUF2273 domain-containing protein [Kyrpidia sp.]